MRNRGHENRTTLAIIVIRYTCVYIYTQSDYGIVCREFWAHATGLILFAILQRFSFVAGSPGSVLGQTFPKPRTRAQHRRNPKLKLALLQIP